MGSRPQNHESFEHGLGHWGKSEEFDFFHLKLSKAAQMFNVAFPLWGFFDPCQLTKTKRCLGRPQVRVGSSSAWGPRVFQASDAIKDGREFAVIFEIAYKVAMPLKLKALAGLNRFQARFNFAVRDF